MLFVGTSIIHPSTEGVFLLCNILDLLIYSSMLFFVTFIMILKLYLQQEKLSPYFNLIFIQIHVFYFYK